MSERRSRRSIGSDFFYFFALSLFSVSLFFCGCDRGRRTDAHEMLLTRKPWSSFLFLNFSAFIFCKHDYKFCQVNRADNFQVKDIIARKSLVESHARARLAVFCAAVKIPRNSFDFPLPFLSPKKQVRANFQKGNNAPKSLLLPPSLAAKEGREKSWWMYGDY